MDAADTSERELLDRPEAGPAAVRGGAVRVVGYGVGIILTTGSAALLFRHLGVDDTGRYVTVLALIAIVVGVTDVGLTTIGLRELAVREAPEQRRLLENMLGVRLTLAIAGVLAVTAFAWIAGYTRSMVLGTVLAGIGVVAIAMQSTLGMVLMARLQFGWVTALEIVRQAVLAALIVTLVLAGAGLLPFLAAQAPAAIVALVLTAWLVRHDAPLLPAFRGGEWRVLIREVLPYSAATIVATLYFRSALIVLGLVSTDTQTGYFGAAFRVMDVLLLLPGLMVGAAFPIFSRAARDDHDRLAYGVSRVFQASLVAGGAVLVGLVLGAPFAIDVIAGHGFAPSADVLRVLAIALFVSFAATTLFYALLSLRMHGAILAVSCLVFAVSVAVAAVFGSLHGARGAAWATVAAELAGITLAATMLARRHPDVAPGLRGIPPVLVSIGLALLVWLIPGLPSVVAALLGVAIYAGSAWVLGAVPAEVVDAFVRRR
jgi:O-antigen/teichoic acid export membrane protein